MATTVTNFSRDGQVLCLVLDGCIIATQFTETLSNPAMSYARTQSVSTALREGQLCLVVVQGTTELTCRGFRNPYSKTSHPQECDSFVLRHGHMHMIHLFVSECIVNILYMTDDTLVCESMSTYTSLHTPYMYMYMYVTTA